jgi:outer membrane receptor protein involved in Fe transport
MPTLIWLTNSFYANQIIIYSKLKFWREYFQNFLQLSIPGFRFEKIRTQAEGSYRKINLDLAGNVILDENQQENKQQNFVLFGVGLSYKPQNQIELYGNVSQNYRSVTFNDIRTVSPSNVIDPNISDEKDLLQTLVYN